MPRLVLAVRQLHASTARYWHCGGLTRSLWPAIPFAGPRPARRCADAPEITVRLQEWDAARSPGVRFAGAVVVLPAATDWVLTPEVTAHRPVETYRTDDGAVQCLRNHDKALSTAFSPVNLTC